MDTGRERTRVRDAFEKCRSEGNVPGSPRFSADGGWSCLSLALSKQCDCADGWFRCFVAVVDAGVAAKGIFNLCGCIVLISYKSTLLKMLNNPVNIEMFYIVMIQG